MLVLSRRVGEAIVLPVEDVIIRVLNVRGGSIRLGITAPSKIAVHREEVWRKIFASGPPELPPEIPELPEISPLPELFVEDGDFDVPVLPR